MTETSEERARALPGRPLLTAGNTRSGQGRSSPGRDDSLVRLAVPSAGEGALGAQRSSHFGNYACSTLVDIDHGELTQVRTLSNPAGAGGCQRPVELLASNGVTAVVVGAIGYRPLAALTATGINVLFDASSTGVGEAVEAARLGVTPVMSPQWACRPDRHTARCRAGGGRPGG